jgi:two-component system cell cycle sensor histidine kinase/response regulator CckA
MTAKRVLVVEDDSMVRYLAAESLRDDGFEVVEASDGDVAAAQLVDPDNFDVLLTDVRMPSKLDGIEVAAHARKLDPEIAVIVVSGFAAGLADRLKSLDPPLVFLPKPYSLKQIVEVVRQAAG